MRLLFLVLFFNIFLVLDAAKTTTSEPINLVVAKTTKANAVAADTEISSKTVPTVDVEEEVVAVVKGAGKVTTAATKDVEGEEIIPAKNVKNGKATTATVEINIKNGKATTTIKPSKTEEEIESAGKAPPNPPIDAVVTTIKAGKIATTLKPSKTEEEEVESIKEDKFQPDPLLDAAATIFKAASMNVEVEEIIPAKNVKNGKATTAAVEINIKSGKTATTIKPSKIAEEEEIEPIKSGKATTLGKAPPNPPVETATTKSGKVAAETTTIKSGKQVTTVKEEKTTTTIKPAAAKTTIKEVKTTTTTKAPKTTTTTSTTTTTTTTPSPPSANGFLTFVRDAANFRPTFSICGYFCNILGVKTRKKRLMDYSSLLAGLNQRDAHFKAINKADFKLAIERTSGLPSPAIAAIQSQDLS